MKNINKNLVTTLIAVFSVLGLTLPITTFAVSLPPINLGTAGDYAILAETSVFNVPSSTITGNVGVNAASKNFLTGWSLKKEPTRTYFTSSQVITPGKLYSSDLVGGTTSLNLNMAINDMQTAYTEAVGRYTNITNLGTNGDIGGLTITPSSYGFANGMTMSDDITLDCGGNPTALFVFQIDGNLNISAGKSVNLINSCQPSQIFWQVSGTVTLEVGSHFEGIILAQQNIVMKNGATLEGRALSQAGVAMSANTITAPTSTPMAKLSLSAVPASQTIFESTLFPETNGIPDDQIAVDFAITGLTPISLSIDNTGNADSAYLKINPIGNSSGHIQLWARDLNGYLYDINVTGWGPWGPTTGFSVPAGGNNTIDVYVISDKKNYYNLTANLILASNSSVVATTEVGINVKR